VGGNIDADFELAPLAALGLALPALATSGPETPRRDFP
jgi:hypothetical protein